MPNDLIVLFISAIAILFLELYIIYREDKDVRMERLMRNGQGPNHYMTYWGRPIENKKCFNARIKKKINELGLNKLFKK